MAQIDWTISLVLIGLFSIAIIGFAISFANDNNAVVSITSDSDISTLYTENTGNSSQFGTDASDTYTSILNSTINPNSASGTTTTAGTFSITPANMINVVTNTLRTGYTKIFGTGGGFGVFLTTFLGLIVFITALLIWKTWAGRSPE